MMKIVPIVFLIVKVAISVKTNGTEVEVSLHGSDGIDPKRSNFDHVTSVSRVLDFYNSEILEENLHFAKSDLTNSCYENVGRYVDGLRNVEKWALKVEDSSGKYATGWFWGNQFWIGSQSMCENIPYDPEYSTSYEQKNGTRFRRNIENQQSTKVSPSQSKGYDAKLHTNSSSPSPFQVAFFTLRINVNATISAKAKTIYLGLCLPQSCTDEDVKILVEKISEASPSVSINVESVRSPHHYFNIWDDPTFKALCIFTAIICIFLAGGTGYDVYSKTPKNCKKISNVECITYADSENKLTEKHIKLNVNNLDSKHGKSCLHVNNNNSNNNNNNNVETSTEICMEPISEKKDSALMYVLKQILLSFSIRINTNTICDRSVGSDTISSIHGLKTISMIWVVLGHTCIIAFKYSDNMEYRRVVQKEFIFQTITNGAFSVDTFFFTSGLLVSFLYFRSNAKGKLDSLGRKGFLAGCTHFMGLIAYRFARLTVPYLFVLGMVEVCMKWFNYNSIFEPPTMDHVNCPKYWWRNVLYINTLFPDNEMCMLWSWYLSDDTQFYVLGAILLIVGVSHFKTATAATAIFLMSSWFTTGYVSLSNSHLPSTNDPLALFDKIYDKPWTRLGPYLIGMMAGWLLFKTNCRIKMSKLAIIVGWLVSAACLLSLVYGLYEADISPIAGAAYSSLSHTAWALGLAWIVIACATGNGGFVSSILSATILYPISRITYCAYLLHPLVMRVMVMNMDSPLHLGKPLMVTIFFGQALMSYILGFIVSVMFEAPVVSMLKIFTKIGPGKQKVVES